ncbi:MAG: hypothetical protein ACE5J4_01350 [Candidatus Aenigmatarchaeota archaeon]
MTNKTIAAILNFIVWGSGYLYIGKRKVFAWSLLIAYILVHWYWFTIGFGQVWTTIPGFASFIGHVIMSIGLAYDVYKE